MDVLVLSEDLAESGVDDVRLVGVHGPAHRKIKLLLLEVGPAAALHHELPRDLGPALFPVDARIVDQHCYFVDSSVVADQCEPAVGHRPELVLVLDEPVVIQLILVHRALLVESDGIVLS